MKLVRPGMGVATAALVVLLAACGTSRNVVTVQEASGITKGQELIDLQRAKAEGAINDGEYETLRKVIMKRPQ